MNAKQFEYINYQIVKARNMPEKNCYDLQCKVEKLILQNEFIIDLTSVEPSQRKYKNVDYFVNFYQAMYNDQMRVDVAHIMKSYIELLLGAEITKIHYIVIPEESNFLLGLEVGKELHKSVISITNKERIINDVYWDGYYDKNNRNNIIVLHDVLVTGTCIYESLKKLPGETYNLFGVFCLCKYNHKGYQPIQNLEEHGIDGTRVKCLFEVDEDILRKVVEQ